MSVPRSISFVIPGKLGIGFQVTAVEHDGNIDFTIDVLGGPKNSADLRGVFMQFNEAQLPGLQILGGGGLITGKQIAANGVSNLGGGVNMNGKATPFDIGMSFGTPGKGHDFVTGPVKFTLDGANNLTLDDIAHLQFGVRSTSVGEKSTFTVPAAPDARDDAFSIFEDGAANLNSPSTVPAGVKFELLANDTDGDGDKLVITSVQGAQHGTVQIVDGADADTLVGDAVLYTLHEDYSGPDSFTYAVSDGHGGQDGATVNISTTAVADVPDLTWSTKAGSAVNKILLDVTAKQTDADGSEFIDRIDLSGLPPGTTVSELGVDPGTQPGTLTHQFELTLPTGVDSVFDLTITATSKETSNGDVQTATATVPIIYEYNTSTKAVEFGAEDQSIWETGSQFTFTDDRFLGIDTGEFTKKTGEAIYAGVDGHIKVGFQSKLVFEGGEIDADAKYDVTVETSYNKTTDQLLIDTGTSLTSASFSTEGPEGSYNLDFIFDVLLKAYAGVNIADVLTGRYDFPAIDIPGGSAPDVTSILDLSGDDINGTIEFPPPLDALSIDFAWPDITTNGSSTTSSVTANGASNNFLQLNLDLDDLVFQLLGVPVNPFDPERVGFLEVAFADPDLLDIGINGGMNFLQDFAMSMGAFTAELEFENGTSQSYTIGQDLLINNAKSIDVDNDGLVEFTLDLDPAATLRNDTDLGFNIGGAISLLSIEVGYDLGGGIDDSVTLGPLASFGTSFPVASVGVYDKTFALNFEQQDLMLYA
jgi:hypothetical protein